jgi:hypothetical protein
VSSHINEDMLTNGQMNSIIDIISRTSPPGLPGQTCTSKKPAASAYENTPVKVQGTADKAPEDPHTHLHHNGLSGHQQGKLPVQMTGIINPSAQTATPPTALTVLPESTPRQHISMVKCYACDELLPSGGGCDHLVVEHLSTYLTSPDEGNENEVEAVVCSAIV